MGPSEATSPPPGAQTPQRHPDTPSPGSRMGPHYGMCFGCGDLHPTGLHLEVQAEEGVRITARFTVTDDHQGAPGLAHGGVLAAAFDEALGSLLWVLGRPGVTGRLETDFLRPVPVGETLFIEAWCTGVDGRKIYTEAEGRLGGADGEVALRSAGLFIAVDAEHFAKHGGRGVDEAFRSRFNP